jgi:hypothetical protein
VRVRFAIALGVVLAVGSGAAGAIASSTSASGPRPAITGSIHLKHREIRAGRTVRGELVFENHTSKTKVLLHGCKVNGLYAVGLRASDGYIQEPAFTLVGCSRQQAMVARPGKTVYRFKLPATYTQCSQSAKHQPSRGSKNWSPVCLRDASGERDIMPPLPPGKYTAVFFPNGVWHGPHVKSAGLVVTRAK